jgi:hemerythrin-like metal-binding protein
MSLRLDYQTGLLWQDTQHSEWIDFFRKLEQAAKEDQDHLIFDQMISFLAMYVNHHFDLEKQYMEKYDYPEKKFHLEEHRLYILQLKDFRKKHRGYSKEAVLKIIDTMTNWIYSHILGNDKKLGQFILKTERGWNAE